MRLQGFVLGDLAGPMIDIFTLVVAISIVLVITTYACSRAAALAWFRTKLEFVRSVIREGAPDNGKD
jgi:hypothetical protein